MKKGLRRHWKKLFFSLLAVGIAVGGYVIYQLQFKDYDVADEEVDQITKDDYTIELPDGSTIGDGDLNGDENVSGNASGTGSGDNAQGGAPDSVSDKIVSSNNESGGAESAVTDASQATSDNPSSTSGSGSSLKENAGSGSADQSSPSGEKPTVASIKSKYEPSFANLQSQANGKIGSLVGHAKAEYTEMKNSGESISYGYFYQKYMSAAASLEEKTDSAFNQLIGAVEGELQKNGFSKEYAQSFRDEYKAEKEAMRSNIISSVMNR